MTTPLRLFQSLLVVLLGYCGIAQAQTITTGGLLKTSFCPGDSISVPFSAPGLAANTPLKVQYAPTNGSFIDLATTGSNSSSPLTAKIPTNAGAGTYRIQVTTVTSSTAIKPVPSPNTITIGVIPSPPGVRPLSFCLGESKPLTASASNGGKLNWYTSINQEQPLATTPTSPTAVGTTPYYVSQTIGTCESQRVPVTVTVNPIPAPPGVDASLTFCQNDSKTLTATAVSGATLNWYGTDKTGGTPSNIATKPSTNTPGKTVYYVSQSIGSCQSDRAEITVTVNAAPDAPTVVTPIAYCQKDSPKPLSATASGGNTLVWYGTNQTGGTPSATAPASPTAPKQYTYYVAQKDANDCESKRTPINVTVTATPSAPSTNPVIYCQGNAPAALTVRATSGGTINWYNTENLLEKPLATAPAPPTAVGTTTYYVSQSVNDCESDRVPLTVTVNPLPLAPSVVNPAPYCQGATANPLSATAATGNKLNWYGTNDKGETATTTQIPLTNTTATYYVSQTDANGCESPRASVVVTVNPLPAAPTVVTPLTYCQAGPYKPLSATASSGNTIVWYGTNQTGGTESTTTPSSPTTAGDYTYFVAQRDANNCVSPRVPIIVNVTKIPSAPSTSPVVICQNVTPTALIAGGVNLTWYGTDTTSMGSATPTIPSSATVGVTKYYVSQSVSGCESPKASITVTVRALPAAPSVATPAPYCQGATAAPLSATAATGNKIKWYGTNATGGTAAERQIPSTNATATYYVSQTDANSCESPRAPVIVTINPKPDTVKTTPLVICQNTTPVALNATPTAGDTLKWYLNASGGTPSLTPPPYSTQVATTITYYVSQKDAKGCESDRRSLVVTINPTPTKPTVTGTPSACQFTNPVTLSATGQNLKWYTDSTTTSSLGNTLTQQTDEAGTFSYYVSQSLRACEGPRTLAQVIIKPQPGLPGVSNVAVCQDAPNQALTANSANGGSLQWFDANDNSLQSAPTPATNVNQTATYTYKVNQTVNGCVSNKASLTYTVNVTPLPTVVSPAVYCQNQTSQPLQASGTGLKWTDPYGNVSANTPTPPTLNVTEGANYQVTQTSAATGCESRKATIKLIINGPPTARVDGGGTVNLGMPATLTLTFTSTGPYSFTLSDGTTGTSDTQTKTVSVTPKASTIYTVASISNACGSGIPVGTATINVTIPTITTSALSSATVCAGTQLVVPFTTSGQFNTGNAFRVEIANSVGDSATRQYTALSTSDASGLLSATIPATITQGQYFVRVTASNPSIPVPGSNSPTLLTIKALPTATLSGTKDIYFGQSTNLSFALTGDGPWTITYADSSTSYTVNTTTNPYVVAVIPAKKTTYTATTVSNNCGYGTASGTATIQVLPVLGVEPDPLVNSVKVYPVPTDGAVTIDIDLPLQKTPAEFELIDLNGRVDKQFTTRQRQTTLSLNAHPSGIYLLRIKVGNRSTVRRIEKR